MEFTVGLDTPFSLDYTMESGQLFRWERKGEWWIGAVPGGVLKLNQEGDVLKCSSGSSELDSSFVRRYFKLDLDIEPVLSSITRDPHITQAVERFYGLRIVRQDRWECLASFLLATNANIPRIKKMVSAVCTRYGVAWEFERVQFNLFPVPGALADAKLSDLRRCGLGYRGPFLKRVASKVASGEVDLRALDELDYDSAKQFLLKEVLGEKVLAGVGPKVADCVLLFSCDKDQAFPIDVWIARALATYYPDLLPPRLKKGLETDSPSKIGPKDYESLSFAARTYFGQYAGYAQQYLYMAARSEGP